ncbi:MAG: hypothetical protein ACREHF_08915 [Rhizomicrobium sp.]
MSNVNIDSVKTCFIHQQLDEHYNSVECPVGMIQDSYFEFRDVGLDLSDIFKWQIHGCEFYNAGNGVNVCGDCNYGTAYDIHLRNANVVNIMGCRFSRAAAANRYNIYVDADHPSATGKAKNVLIGQNQFGDDIPGDHGLSAIVLSPSAQSVVIGVNAYIGQYTGSVVDDQTSTGQAVSPLGFPSTGALTPPATVPSSYTANLSPTLGNADGPWPQSFSQAHFLKYSSAPTIPSTYGWVVYASGNALYAYDGTTKKQLAP